MEDMVPADSEAEMLDEQVTAIDSTDDFASIREHYEAGVALSDEETDKVADQAVTFLKGILALFGETHCTVDEYDGDEGELILDVNGGDLAVLIGRHGRTLDALQMVLSSLMSSRTKFHYPIIVDIESYKSRRKSKLQAVAHAAAERAKRQGGRVVLAPMNAYERRLVHLALVDDPSVVTFSEGEEPNRKVVVTAVK